MTSIPRASVGAKPKIYMYVWNKGRRQRSGHSSILVGTIVFERNEAQYVKNLGKDELLVQTVPYDNEGDKNEAFNCHKSCLKEIKGDESDILLAIKDKKERHRLFIDERFDVENLSLLKSRVTVTHPKNESSVQGKVKCETTRPDRMGTWWKIVLDEVTHSLLKFKDFVMLKYEKVIEGTHTVYFSSSLCIINQKSMITITHFHCITTWVARSSG